MPLSGAFMTSSMEAVAFSRRLSGVIAASWPFEGAAKANAIARQSREAMVLALRDGLVILGIEGLLRAYLGTFGTKFHHRVNRVRRASMIDESRWFTDR